MKYKDYYEVLGVAKDSAEKDVKSAYRKLARKWHPDANPTNAKQAEERFKEISEAYEVVGDPEKRKKYDALGSNWEQAQAQAEAQRRYREAQAAQGAQYRTAASGGDPSGGANASGASGFSDFFDSFFSGGGGGGGVPGRRGASFAQRGTDLDASVEISLADAFAGGSKSVSLQIEDACPRCKGAGVLNNSICPQCHGTGRTIAAKKFDVTIPKGVRDGQRIRLAGQGGRGTSGGPSGDLFLDVEIAPDATYERKGDDLYVDLPVSVYDLVLGASVRVPTMTGDVTMTIPSGTQSNKLLRLGGKGMPRVRGGGAGDQYVRLIGMLPTDLTDRERELYTELARLRRASAAV